MKLFPNNVKILSTFRTIEGGQSKGGFENFNLAFHVDDDTKDVQANRSLLVSHFNLPSEPVWINQVHSNTSVCADSVSSIVSADASYTRNPGIICAVLTADCLPIFVCNKRGTNVGIAHAGWRGIIDGVIESLIESFEDNKEDLIVYLGPAISQLSFQVGIEVKLQYLAKNENFEKCFIFRNNKYYLDLYDAARVILNELGLYSIGGGSKCTYNELDKYFSYRRDGKVSGRMAHLIWME